MNKEKKIGDVEPFDLWVPAMAFAIYALLSELVAKAGLASAERGICVIAAEVVAIRCGFYFFLPRFELVEIATGLRITASGAEGTRVEWRIVEHVVPSVLRLASDCGHAFLGISATIAAGCGESHRGGWQCSSSVRSNPSSGPIHTRSRTGSQ